ncbi:MAG: tetratricopeptide repeat protein [Candidatus Omnitrophota bacterium]
MFRFSQEGKLSAVISSMGFFYCIVLLIFGLFLKDNQSIDTAKLRTLNRLMPPLTDLIKSDLTGQTLEDEQIDKYLFYYTKVSDYIPKNADGFYMEGYCLARKNLLDRAVKAYKRSIELNPQFFWSHYNLGQVYLKLNRKELALESFQRALNIKPESTLKVMLASKVFQQLLAQLDRPQEVLPNNLKMAYKECYQFMIMTNALIAASREEIPVQIYNQLGVKIF